MASLDAEVDMDDHKLGAAALSLLRKRISEFTTKLAPQMCPTTSFSGNCVFQRRSRSPGCDVVLPPAADILALMNNMRSEAFEFTVDADVQTMYRSVVM